MAASLSRALVQVPRRTWGSYIKSLESRPRATKSFTSVCAAILGDALAQHIANSGKNNWEYDWARTTRLAVFNAGMGVLGHEYYKVLDGRVMPHAAKSPRAVMSKLVIDQFLFAPICTAVFYFFKVATEGRPREYVPELQQKYVPTLLAGYQLWIPAHIVNFALVPNRQRILYANVVSIFGTYILSRAQAGDYSQKPGPVVSGGEGRRRQRGTDVLPELVLKQE